MTYTVIEVWESDHKQMVVGEEVFVGVNADGTTFLFD